MNQNYHHRFHPFSWENSPGVSKSSSSISSSSLIHEDYNIPSLKLPPPPGPAHSPKKGRPDILHVPLPPCPFQPPPRYLQAREGDPFLAAYMECTKSVKHNNNNKQEGGGKTKTKKQKKRLVFGRLSCKQLGAGVREDGVVKVSQVATFVSGRERLMLLERSKSHDGSEEGGSTYYGKGHQRQNSLVFSKNFSIC